MKPALGSYPRLRWAARLTTAGVVAAAVIYSIILCVAFDGIAADVLVAATIAASGAYAAFAIIAWQWSLVGGIMVVAAGVIALNFFLPTNYDLRFEAFFDAFSVIYMIGGVLHIVRGCLIRRHRAAE